MTYELALLEEAIEAIAKSIPAGGQMSEKALQAVDEEPERIRKALIATVFNIGKERQLELYVQHHQSALIRLLDCLLQLQPADGPLQDLSNKLCVVLEELLDFIEIHFSKYFDQDQKLPGRYYEVERVGLATAYEELRGQLLERCVDKGLIEIVLSPLDRFVDPPENTYTFRQLIYLKELVSELEDVLRQPIDTSLEDRIIYSMIYLNFNTPKLARHISLRFSAAYGQQETLQLQLEKLAFLRKEVNQVQEKPSFALKPGARTLKQQLTDWLTEESDFLEKKRQLAISFPASGLEVPDEELKLKLNISVPQIAFLIRLLMESGVILNRNTSEVVRFMTRNFGSTKAENISIESFRTKFYNIDSTARQGVKDLVLNLLNLVNKKH